MLWALLRCTRKSLKRVSIKSVKSKKAFDDVNEQKKQRKEDALELAWLVYDMFKSKQLKDSEKPENITNIREQD